MHDVWLGMTPNWIWEVIHILWQSLISFLLGKGLVRNQRTVPGHCTKQHAHNWSWEENTANSNKMATTWKNVCTLCGAWLAIDKGELRISLKHLCLKMVAKKYNKESYLNISFCYFPWKVIVRAQKIILMKSSWLWWHV